MIKTVSKKTVYKDAWMSVRQDEIIFPNGKNGTYGVIDRNDGAFVIIYTPEHQILLLKQYRYPIDNFDWGLPGGGINGAESPKEAAKREVREEVGIEVSSLDELGFFYALSSCSTEKIYVFLAEVSVIVPKLQGQYDEQMVETKIVAINEALNMIDSHVITDPVTVSSIQMLARKLANTS